MLGLGINTIGKNLISGASYDIDAQTYFNSIGDIPLYMKQAISDRITAFKANDVWTNMKLFLPFPPTKEIFEGFRDAKTNTINGTQVYTTTKSVNPSSNYEFPRALNGLNGMNYWGDGAFQTGLNTSTLTNNDCCIASIYQDAEVLTSGYNHGVFGGSSNSFLFQKNLIGSKTVSSFGYTNNAGTGKATYISTIDGGVYIQNIDADNKIWEEGVLKDTITGTAGSLPALDFLLNGYSTSGNNGGGSNDTLGAITIYGNSLSNTKITQEQSDWETFQTATKRTGTYNFSMILDGNSHTTRWNTSLFRNMCYNLAGLSEIYTSQIGIWGTEYDAMISAQSAKLFPKVQSYFGKLYMVVWEGTNELASGTSVANSIIKLETYCANLKAEALNKGMTVEIIVPTLLNRQYTGDDSKIIAQSDFNISLIAGNAGSVDKVIELTEPLTSYRADYASDSTFITAVRAFSSAAPFTDGTHLEDSSSGYPVISKLITDYIKVQENI